VVASFTCEAFSTRRLQTLSRAQIDERLAAHFRRHIELAHLVDGGSPVDLGEELDDAIVLFGRIEAGDFHHPDQPLEALEEEPRLIGIAPLLKPEQSGRHP